MAPAYVCAGKELPVVGSWRRAWQSFPGFISILPDFGREGGFCQASAGGGGAGAVKRVGRQGARAK